MRFNFTATAHSISLYFAGKMHSIPEGNAEFEPLFNHLKLSNHDFDVIEQLINKPLRISRLSEGAVTVVGSTVYYRGEPVHSTLTAKLLTLLDLGFDVKPWARFMDNTMSNPSTDSRHSLYDFLEHWQAPITEDGCFLAFKRVRKDYKDIHSGKFDNSPGQFVKIEREKVDPDRNNQCSYGLHVAASSYLDSYRSADSSNTIVCKVNPADVIAVPADYKFAKMRVASYLVLGDAEESDHTEFVKVGMVTKYTESNSAPSEPEAIVQNNTVVGKLDNKAKNNARKLKRKAAATMQHGAKTYDKQMLLDGVKKYGQRGYARITGIPRTTLQDWLARVRS